MTALSLILKLGLLSMSAAAIAESPRATAETRGSGYGPSVAHAPKEILQVGTARAEPGQVSRGVISVLDGVDRGYDIPVILINGSRPGPTIALIAGLHGAEFGGIVALQRLANELEPSSLAGSAVIIPLVNVEAFKHLTPRNNPVDGKNMNRHFPGEASGTQTQRAAHLITEEVLKRADYVIDYHGGDLNEDQQPYAYWILSPSKRVTEAEDRMLRAFGTPYIIKFPLKDMSPATANLLPTQAVVLGKPTVTVDAGHSGTYSPGHLRLLMDGTKRVLAQLGMIAPVSQAQTEPQYLESTVYVNSAETGTFFPLATRGERVRKGQLLGYVTDFYGRRSFEAIAPEDGVILYLNSTPSAVKGEQLFFIGIPQNKASAS